MKNVRYHQTLTQMCLIHPFFFLLLIVCGGTATSADQSAGVSQKWLNVMLVRVDSDSVLLEWSCFPPAVRQQLVTCQARYGLLTPEKTILQQQYHQQQNKESGSTAESTGSWWRFEQTQVDVLDHFLPESNSFRLTNLTTNTSYVFAMICILWAGHREEHHHGKSATFTGHNIHYVTVTSNPIFFTTKSENVGAGRAAGGYPSRYRWHEREESASDYWNDHMDPIRWTSKLSQRPSTSGTLSYNIILGIVCGVIGFLIINVTIVMALRKYSRWRSRQARIRHLRFIYGDTADNYYDVT